MGGKRVRLLQERSTVEVRHRRLRIHIGVQLQPTRQAESLLHAQGPVPRVEGAQRADDPRRSGVHRVRPRQRPLREPAGTVGGRRQGARGRDSDRGRSRDEATGTREQTAGDRRHHPDGIRSPPHRLFGLLVGHGTRPHDDLPRLSEHRERRGGHDQDARSVLLEILPHGFGVRQLRRAGLGQGHEAGRRRCPPRRGADERSAPVPDDQVSEGHAHRLHPPDLCVDRGGGWIHQRRQSSGRQLPPVVFGGSENAEYHPRSRQLPELLEDGRSGFGIAVGRALVPIGFGEEHRSRLQSTHCQSERHGQQTPSLVDSRGWCRRAKVVHHSVHRGRGTVDPPW
mmetsp:Transcript_8982/g.21922  ORF Transcript_8982/g.21922 Transcript_8982/m.21922 type:complete len:340 (-) Transcript_8982:819-1838(-)